MAVEKDRIKARLKALFPGVNLSKQRLDEISDRLSPKPADDAEDATIDELIKEHDFHNPFAELAKTDDLIRTLKANQKATPTPAPATPPTPTDPTPAPQDKDPLTLMLEEMRALKQDLQGLKAEKQQSTIKEKAKTALKDVPEVFWKRAPLPENEADLETWAEEIKTDYTALKQVEVNANLGNGGTARGTAGEKKAAPEQVKSILDKIM